ncbi:hypothetical protein GTV32_22850 [Gordonia sp. SID5947]|nr:hypothetical protein [Gordonia sp. SID5947]
MTQHPRTRDEIDAALATRSVEQIIAAVDAGHTMAGMPLTDRDKDAIRRIDSGETTIEQERQRILDEIAADRDSETPTEQ